MNIVYEIDFLGRGHIEPENRTGVYRVVEHIAEGIIHSGNKVNFVAQEYMQEASDYLQHNHKLMPHKINCTNSLFNTTLHKLHSTLSQAEKSALHRYYEGKEKLTLISKLYRKALFTTHEIIPKANLSEFPFYDRILDRADIYHSPYGKITSYIRGFKQLKCFLTVYDLIPILFPEYVNFITDSWTKVAINSLHPNDWIFAISEATKNDLCEYRKDINPNQVIVTHLAASKEKFYSCTNRLDFERVFKKYNIPLEATYFLGLSTLAPHKNFNLLIRCFGKLLQQEKLDNLYLVLVGSKGWDSKEVFQEINQSDWLRKRVLFTGRVEDKDLAPLYSGAVSFIYPSIYEGFGLPPLEAMQCGVPVITSNTSSLPEVVGDAGIMISPTDEDALCQAMLTLYQSESLRSNMSSKSLQQASKFSWNKCVQDTVNGYTMAMQT